MTADRFQTLTANYAKLRLAVVGDFCLDRYMEIDPARAETSIETGLPVHNVVNLRAQPGAAGTIVNNLVALGVGTIFPIGFCGEDGEGFELRRALASLRGVNLSHFISTPLRRTFTYCKPLVIHPAKSPLELNRLDSKNWTPTPAILSGEICTRLMELRWNIDAMVVMDQVDIPETGVVGKRVLEQLPLFSANGRQTPVIADSRRGLRGYPPLMFKMNAAELAALTSAPSALSVDEIKAAAGELALHNKREVFVTMAERGIVGADAKGGVEYVPALPLRGPIDVVGAGDAVTANLCAAFAAGATLREAIELASIASSIVIHQLGTTGTATVRQIEELLPLLNS